MSYGARTPMLPKADEPPRRKIHAGKQAKDMSGERHGVLLVLERAEAPPVRFTFSPPQPWWICQCDCGRLTIESAQRVRLDPKKCRCPKS